MNTKQQFMRAVQILAPNDSFIYQAAQRVSEDTLPVAPGGAALQFVVSMERLRTSVAFTAASCGPGCKRRFRIKPQKRAETALTRDGQMPMPDALRIKTAEFWLKLGQPAQALKELATLSDAVRKQPWALKVQLSAVHGARERGELPAHAE